MNVKELRPGNYICFKNGKEISPVSRLSDETDEIATVERPLCKSSYFEAIPLTEEWLLRFGLKENINSDRLRPKYDLPNTAFTVLIDMDDNGEFIYIVVYGGSIILMLKSVHQLQNFQFALTGQELCVTQP